MRPETNIAIVGSGPSALGVLHGLTEFSILNSGTNVTIISPPETNEASIKLEMLSATKGLKPLFGALHPYDLGTFLNFRLEKGVCVVPSKTRAGFSSVWGAAIGNSHDFNFLGSYNMNSNIALNRIFSKGFNFNEQHNLAVDSANCIFCGMCLSGCSYKAIWDSRESFDRAVFNSGAKLIQDYVETLEWDHSKVKINLKSGNQLRFDRVFLCCGPISSLSILLKSNLIEEPVFIKDTRMIYMIGIRIPRRYSKNSFALSTRFHKMRFPNLQQAEAYIQIYDDTRGLWFRFDWLQKLFWQKTIFDFISRFFVVSLMYLDESKSAHIKLSSHRNLICLSKKNSRSETFFAIAAISKALRDISKLRFIPVFAWKSKVGGSFHVGSIYGSKSTNSLRVSKNIDNKIYLCDSSTLTNLPTGPITPQIYSNAKTISSEHLEHFS